MPQTVLDSLPSAIADAVSPLLEAYPIDEAMKKLVVHIGASIEHIQLVESVIRRAAIGKRPELCAGLWLYVDELERSHEISQQINNATGSFWHGIMHRREGDFSNSHYWFRSTGSHPAMADIAGYDSHQFVDDVATACSAGNADEALIDMQRREWATLFAWCAAK